MKIYFFIIALFLSSCRCNKDNNSSDPQPNVKYDRSDIRCYEGNFIAYEGVAMGRMKRIGHFDEVFFFEFKEEATRKIRRIQGNNCTIVYYTD